MASTPLEQEVAEDITDLREAQRMIAELRRQLAQASALAYGDGEFTIFLDDEHTQMVFKLFEQRRLMPHQPADCELHDALSEAVSYWLDRHCAPHTTRRASRRPPLRSLSRNA